MAVSLQSDPTLAGFNSNCSRDEANEFLLERRLFASAWETCANKDAALIWATRELDRLNWGGIKVADTQRHAWPRDGFDDVNTTEVPEAVKDATAELAFYLAQTDQTQPAAQELLEELQVDVIKLKFRESPTGRELTSEMPDSVMGMVKPYLAAASLSTVNRKAIRV